MYEQNKQNRKQRLYLFGELCNIFVEFQILSFQNVANMKLSMKYFMFLIFIKVFNLWYVRQLTLNSD